MAASLARAGGGGQRDGEGGMGERGVGWNPALPGPQEQQRLEKRLGVELGTICRVVGTVSDKTSRSGLLCHQHIAWGVTMVATTLDSRASPGRTQLAPSWHPSGTQFDMAAGSLRGGARSSDAHVLAALRRGRETGVRRFLRREPSTDLRCVPREQQVQRLYAHDAHLRAENALRLAREFVSGLWRRQGAGWGAMGEAVAAAWQDMPFLGAAHPTLGGLFRQNGAQSRLHGGSSPCREASLKAKPQPAVTSNEGSLRDDDSIKATLSPFTRRFFCLPGLPLLLEVRREGECRVSPAPCNIASIGEPVPSIKTPPYSSPARSPREPQRGADVVRWRRRSFLRSESLAQRGGSRATVTLWAEAARRDSITGRARQLANWGIGGQEEGKGTFAEALAWTLNTWQPALAPEAVRTGFARWGRRSGSGVRGFASSREAAHHHRHDAVDGVADGTLHKATMADFDD
ncbi:hypothetical protein ACCO45_004174 [Purpureocillium lilacinum]|uniref:Uncharacterized protein n=1 Tax=Purpureocillium lilacinum TaxID=33203 RepID=A0ACC4E4U5_PURLI